MSRIRNLQVEDKILTQIARGFHDAQFVAEMFLPTVRVDTLTGRIRTFDKSFFRTFTTLRAMRAKTNLAPVDEIGNISFLLNEHDIAVPMDYLELKVSTSTAVSYDIKARYARQTARIIERGIEVKSANLLQDPLLYPVGHSAVLAAGDKFDDPTSDPIQIIQDSAQVITSKVGLKPNKLLLDRLSYNALRNHPKLIERIQYAQVGVLTVELMQTLFDIDQIVVADSVYTESATSDFKYIWDKCAILAYVTPSAADQRDPEEPSFGYRLQYNPGIVTDEYSESGGKINYVRSTDIYEHKVLGPEAGFLIQGTVV